MKVLDFGVAKLTERAGDDDGFQTKAGVLLGTPAYMSPEQALAETIDSRTDIYALAVILFELLTGDLPLRAETTGQFIVMHATQKPRLLRDEQPGLPPRLDRLIGRCLAKAPDDRPATMDELADELEEIAAGIEDSAQPDASLESTLPPPPPFDGASELPLDASPGRDSITEIISTVGATRRAGPSALTAMFGVLALGLVAGAIAMAWPARESERASAGEPSRSERESPAPVLPADPPAVAAPPTAIAAPPEETLVRVSFHSRPEGAEVWREGADEPLGTTPLSLELTSSEQSAAFELRLEGYETHREELTLTQDVRSSVSLARARTTNRRRRTGRAPTATPPAPTPAPATPAPSRTGRRGVLSF